MPSFAIRTWLILAAATVLLPLALASSAPVTSETVREMFDHAYAARTAPTATPTQFLVLCARLASRHLSDLYAVAGTLLT